MSLLRFFRKPVHLFVFTHGPLVWRFTSSDVDVVVGDITYLAVPGIERSAVRESTERKKNELKITLPYVLDPGITNKPPTQSLGDLWRPYPPSGEVAVTCLSMDRSDAVPMVDWMGWVVQPEFGDTELELTCSRVHARHRARSGQLRVQRVCPLLPYSQGRGQCNMNPDDFALDAEAIAVTGTTVQAAAFADAPLPLAGGFIRWERADGRVERRTIMSHSGSTITLDYPPAGLAAEMPLTAWPGCDQSWSACQARGNQDNYGGYPHLPVKNPWDGHPL